MKRRVTERDIPALIRAGETLRSVELDLRDIGAVRQARFVRRCQDSILTVIQRLAPVPRANRSAWFASLPEGL